MTIYGVGLVLWLLGIAWGVWMLWRWLKEPSGWRLASIEHKASMPQGPYREPAKVESEPRDYPLNPLRRIEAAAEDVAQRAEAARIRLAEAEKQLRRAVLALEMEPQLDELEAIAARLEKMRDGHCGKCGAPMYGLKRMRPTDETHCPKCGHFHWMTSGGLQAAPIAHKARSEP